MTAQIIVYIDGDAEFCRPYLTSKDFGVFQRMAEREIIYCEFDDRTGRWVRMLPARVLQFLSR